MGEKVCEFGSGNKSGSSNNVIWIIIIIFIILILFPGIFGSSR
jgi:hypothetical protein